MIHHALHLTQSSSTRCEMCEHPRGRGAPGPSAPPPPTAATTQPTTQPAQQPAAALGTAWTAVDGMLHGFLQDSQLGSESSEPSPPGALQACAQVNPPVPLGCSPTSPVGARCRGWVLTGSKLTDEEHDCLERMATMFGTIVCQLMHVAENCVLITGTDAC